MTLRADLQSIADRVPDGARVLDVGCGDGALMAWLEAHKDCDARGIELSRDGVNTCLEKGLSVVQGDADTDLKNYPSDGFDIAVLSKTVQATRSPSQVIENLLRIAPRAIISFPNFGHWRVRLSLLFNGRMPVNDTLPVTWHETPNIHLCTATDFARLAQDLGITVSEVFEPIKDVPGAQHALWWFNIRARDAVFDLKRGP
ncbi:MAG: methionine biosynthesis protein MetW [Pseudomonadota bacterium]